MRQIHLGLPFQSFHFPPTMAVDGKREVAATTPVALASPNTTGAEKTMFIDYFAYTCIT